MCKNKKMPFRRCIACGDMKTKENMLRIVKLPKALEFDGAQGGNTFVVDTTMKINGRGAYLCKSNLCHEKASKSRGLERSFKMSIPQEVYQMVEEEMLKVEKR